VSTMRLPLVHLTMSYKNVETEDDIRTAFVCGYARAILYTAVMKSCWEVVETLLKAGINLVVNEKNFWSVCVAQFCSHCYSDKQYSSCLKKLMKTLVQYTTNSAWHNMCLYYDIDPESSYDKVKTELEKALVKAVEGIFTLNNGIEDISTGEGAPKSVLAKAADWVLIKKWLDKDWQNKKLKCVYKGTKDGMNATKFHEFCNNKGATITIIKSKHGKIFGGFMPDAWASKNAYINTTKSWLFSLTAKAKYVMNDPTTYAQYGGYDYSTYGPTFGGGHDIYLATDFGNNTTNYCNRHSYNFPDNTTLTGGYNFQVEEIEVFSIGQK